MRTPGFMAEVSVYRSENHYGMASGDAGDSPAGQVVPALPCCQYRPVCKRYSGTKCVLWGNAPVHAGPCTPCYGEGTGGYQSVIIDGMPVDLVGGAWSGRPYGR